MNNKALFATDDDASKCGYQIPSSNLLGALIVAILFFIAGAFVRPLVADTAVATIRNDWSGMVSANLFDKPRSIMLGVGFVCCSIYSFVYWIFLLRFIEIVWNRFFVRRNDMVMLLGWLFIYVLYLLLIVLAAPTRWWIIVPVTWMLTIILLHTRVNSFRKALAATGFQVIDDSVYVQEPDRKVDPTFTTQLRLLLALRRNYLMKEPLFAISVVATIAISEGSRGSFVTDDQLLFAGIYSAASSLLVVQLLITNAGRVLSGLYRIRERAESNDVQYFDSIVR
ncbi:hypothetical protein [Bradyrhizobium pachyrhizi]|uniref:hypothetical protein n=1 Tax=Bradyrhizobium pachyrhizi TaxID=280333 RepID=UPI00067E5083|nr:hypothetical protein [Bradyrhizobium pachyrhizi]